MSIHNILVENDLAIYAKNATITKSLKFQGQYESPFRYEATELNVDVTYGSLTPSSVDIKILRIGPMCSILVPPFTIAIGSGDGNHAISLQLDSVIGTVFEPRDNTKTIVNVNTTNGGVANYSGVAAMETTGQLTFYKGIGEDPFVAGTTAGLAFAVVVSYEALLQ